MTTMPKMKDEGTSWAREADKNDPLNNKAEDWMRDGVKQIDEKATRPVSPSEGRPSKGAAPTPQKNQESGSDQQQRGMGEDEGPKSGG
jgi:hypothetical protein